MWIIALIGRFHGLSSGNTPMTHGSILTLSTYALDMSDSDPVTLLLRRDKTLNTGRPIP